MKKMINKQHLKKSLLQLNRIVFLFLFMLILLNMPFPCNGQDHKNILKNKIDSKLIESSLIPAADWKPFPGPGDWNHIPDTIRQKYINEAEILLGKTWEPIAASLYLEYAETGVRTIDSYLNNYHKRLSALIMAELFENKGRFLIPIIDGIWAACEISVWANASSPLFRADHPQKLPDINNGKHHIVELRGGEIASAIAWAHYFFKDKFDSITPVINKRIKEEIDKRILTPCLERSDFFWMGFTGRKVNNWNPWVNSNWLICTLLLEDDVERRNKSVKKIVESTNFFVNGYGDDGGCDEGPGYWSRAPGSLFDLLQLLYSASGGSINLFEEKIIYNMGLYLPKMFIGKGMYVNFADASAKVSPNPGLIYNYGKAINDSNMMKYGHYLLDENDNYISGPVNRKLWGLNAFQEIINVEPQLPLIKDSWSPDVQVMTARKQEGSLNGFYIAAKGGHNGESHNHNDVGHFILFYNGNPVFVDAGVGVYNRDTFGPNRYNLWTMQSAYHNLPTINGLMQKNGSEYAAKNIKYKNDIHSVQFSVDIAEAYPEEALVKKWHRNLIYDKRSQVITIEENYHLNRFKKHSELNYLVYLEPIINNGNILFEIDDTTKITMDYDTDQLIPSVEVIDIDDPKLKAVWGEKLYSLKLVINDSKLNSKVMISLKSE
jgi:hypothetical protein